MLVIFSSAPFYADNVKLPRQGDPVPPEIWDNPKHYSFFKDALGAMDGTHFNCCPKASEQHASRDWKGALTQNCLAVCGFNMKILYVFSGWEGSASDAAMFNDARITDLPIPAGKYYLADAGFPIIPSLLISYQGVHYH